MILSLSTKGAGLISPVNFERGSTFGLKIRNEAKTVSRTCQAEVVHVRPFTGGNWIIGAEFVERLSREQVQELKTQC
jgi:hypothetical protein